MTAPTDHRGLTAPGADQLDWPLSVPVLSDGDITLRAHTPHDIDAIVEMATDPLMQEFTTVPTPYERSHAEQFVYEVMPAQWAQRRGEWAIDAIDNGRHRFAGNIGVRGTPHGEIAFALHPWARGRQIMQRAAALAIDWAFTEGGVELIAWRALVGNLGSLRVAHALGFSLDAALSSAVLDQRGPRDMWIGHLKFGDYPVPRAQWLGPVLEGDDLRLRPLRDDDAPRVAQACSDAQTVHWLGSFMPQPFTAAQARDYIHNSWWESARADAIRWAICDRSSDQLLGHVSLGHLHDRPSGDEADIGYWMHPDARGHGTLVRAVALAVEYAFASDGLNRRRLNLNAAATNTASNAVATRLGFTHYATRHAAERLGDGSWDDLFCYELVRPDF